ncbi:hypothetical protein NEF87_001470 [Candidatus Lokiarchaeum ossiferum]|uniref:Peptidyl-prolyl cis-trans isomerase n=1 Tax=Candidatus Lokiarchaeum ossiferum TaxID=2951803 RepID=A0ABY6HP51_9ARCH|nr:hypothetical protein NEF87_001470 [Candidatus Lokiarchaeum sp. B-35]
MGKSKFQVKAQDSIKKKATSPKGRAQYYDEDLPKKSKSNIGFGVFIILMVVVAGGFIGNSINQDNKAKEAAEQEARDFLNPGVTYSPSNDGSTTTTTSTPGSGIQVGDDVELEYTLWIATPQSGNGGVIDTSSPYQGPATFPTTVQKGGLINGFYYAILGMEEGESKTFELPANIDANGDGIDDNSGLEVESYGAPSHDLYNTKLKFTVRVISIS